MQNAQSNALVAGLIVLAFIAMERTNAWRTAAAVMLGACVKIFPLAALTFAIARRRAWRTGLWAVAIGGSLLVLAVARDVPRRRCWRSMRSWRGMSRSTRSSAGSRSWSSCTDGRARRGRTGRCSSPAHSCCCCRSRCAATGGTTRASGSLYLCSVLMFVVLFNHQAERASYVIAFAGATLWFALGAAARWRTAAVLGVRFITIPTDVHAGSGRVLPRGGLRCCIAWRCRYWSSGSRSSASCTRRAPIVQEIQCRIAADSARRPSLSFVASSARRCQRRASRRGRSGRCP